MENYTCEIIKSEIENTEVYGLTFHTETEDIAYSDVTTDLRKLLKLVLLIDETRPPIKIIPELFEDYIF